MILMGANDVMMKWWLLAWGLISVWDVGFIKFNSSLRHANFSFINTLRTALFDTSVHMAYVHDPHFLAFELCTLSSFLSKHV